MPVWIKTPEHQCPWIPEASDALKFVLGPKFSYYERAMQALSLFAISPGPLCSHFIDFQKGKVSIECVPVEDLEGCSKNC